MLARSLSLAFQRVGPSDAPGWSRVPHKCIVRLGERRARRNGVDVAGAGVVVFVNFSELGGARAQGALVYGVRSKAVEKL
jgi:hypothetical protein